MIHKKYQNVLFAFLMALFMSCFMSLVISIFNVGLVDNILQVWLHAWGFAFVVAFPAVMVVAPTVKRLVELVIQKDEY